MYVYIVLLYKTIDDHPKKQKTTQKITIKTWGR
jgi:hypothetical protein